MSKYPTRRKLSRIVPYGYKISDYDPKLLIPIENEMDALQKAKQYLKTCSYAEVARWISAKTGRYISEIGFMKLIKRERKKLEKHYYENRKRKDKETRAVARAAKAQIKETGDPGIFASPDSQTGTIPA